MPTYADMVYQLGGMPVSGELPLCIGKVIFVSSSKGNDTEYDGLTKDKPYATIDKAISMSTHDDMIILMPGHTEAISATTTFNVDKDHLTIWGMGNYDRRPAFNITTASGNRVIVSGANCRLHNMKISAGTTKAVQVGLYVEDKGCVLTNLLFEEGGSTGTSHTKDAFQRVILTGATANEADGLVINNCQINCPSSLKTSAIEIGAVMNDIKILNNNIVAHCATGTFAPIYCAATGAAQNWAILGNTIINAFATTTAPGIKILCEAAGTGIVIAGNLFAQGSTDVATFKTNTILVSATAAGQVILAENYVCGKVQMSGILSPAVVTS